MTPEDELALQQKRQVFAVVRVDRDLPDPQLTVSVKEVLPSFDDAQNEVERLNRESRDGPKYFLQATRLYPNGRSSRRAAVSRDTHVTFLASAEERLPFLMQSFQEVVNAAFDASLRIRRPKSNFDHVLIRFYERGFNALKAAHLLLGNDYWEFCAPLTRQLFEMVMNVHELHRFGSSREEAATRFMRYAALQDALHQKATLEYDIKRGTPPLNAPTPSMIEDLCRELFPEFVLHDARGRRRWARSWSGRTTAELARDSQRSIHGHQYRALYSFLSAHVHASPTAIVGGFREVSEEWTEDELLRERQRENDVELVQVGGLTLALFFDLWVGCEQIIPQPTHAVLDAIGAVGAFMREANADFDSRVADT